MFATIEMSSFRFIGIWKNTPHGSYRANSYGLRRIQKWHHEPLEFDTHPGVCG